MENIYKRYGLKHNTTYKVTKHFDAYYCDIGRVTVNPGAEFMLTGDNCIYFIHSKNYLPGTAKIDFITSCGYEIKQ